MDNCDPCVAAVEEIKALRKSLATLERIVTHYGLNHTERGLPHPQQQALDEARKLLVL